MKWLATRIIANLLIGLFVMANATAQTPAPPASPASEQPLSPEQLEALVSPIALYPDSLLSLVLMASTYPIEIVQADRWIKANQKLKKDELKTAIDKQAWDDSIKALAAAPDVLSTMSSQLEWTLKLGNAVLAQQADVMEAVQRLRTRAEASNKLSTTPQQRVTKSQRPASTSTPPAQPGPAPYGSDYIYIEQTDPEMLYVPYYDPAVMYGTWPYYAYPPYYFGYPGYIAGALIRAGLAFGAGWALGNWSSGGNYWGGGINWNNNNININRPRVNPLGGNNWQHRPEHRHGVRYGNSDVRQRFGDNRPGVSDRMEHRGRDGLGAGAGLGAAAGIGIGAGLRPGTGQRPNAGQLPAGRPGAGQLPAGRPGAGQTPGRPPGATQRPSGKPGAGQRPQGRPSAGQLPARGGGGNAFGNRTPGRVANRQSAQGRASLGSRGGASFRGGGGGRSVGGGGGRSFSGGGRGGGRGGGGGGRRSDITVKHDVVQLGRLSNGLGYYRFSYDGSNRMYVGVIAQEVQVVRPDAVSRGADGFLRVDYEKLGIKFLTYERWMASGARIPTGVAVSH